MRRSEGNRLRRESSVHAVDDACLSVLWVKMKCERSRVFALRVSVETRAVIVQVYSRLTRIVLP